MHFGAAAEIAVLGGRASCRRLAFDPIWDDNLRSRGRSPAGSDASSSPSDGNVPRRCRARVDTAEPNLTVYVVTATVLQGDAGLEYLVGFILGFLAARFLRLPSWVRELTGGPAETAGPKDADGQNVASAVAGALAREQESLASRLHKLDAAIAPIASNSAHPRELSELPQFIEAVGILQDAKVPLDVVTQYVFGANWVLSCVALAALSGRPDGAQALGPSRGLIRQSRAVGDVLRA